MKKKRGKSVSRAGRNSGGAPATGSQKHLRFRVMAIGAFLVIGTLVALGVLHETQTEFHQPRTFAELIKLPASQLDQVDIGLMNLLCAEGLHGAEDMDVSRDTQTLDEWANLIKEATQRNFYRYDQDPAQFDHSESEYRILVLSTVLKRDLGVQYDPRFTSAPLDGSDDGVFYQDAKDCFINGAVSGTRIGSCATLPVLYIAVGRRLGYPLKLVSTKKHSFLRWDDGKERFDIEATSSGGCNFYADDHYKQWPFPISDEEIKENGYLQNMSAAEELASFLAMRSDNLIANQKIDDALELLPLELRLAPHSRDYQKMASHWLMMLERELVDYPQNYASELPALRQQYGLNSSAEAEYLAGFQQRMQRLEKIKVALTALVTPDKPD